jgi:nucleolar protein 58
VEGKIGKKLKKVLKKIVADDAHEQLAVADSLLGKAIKVRSPDFRFPFKFVS